MPSDANGVYTLPPGYLAVTGNTVQPSQHNPPLEDIAAALTARLSASGVNPMTGPLKATDGLVGAPGLTFNTAQTTGFYKTAGGNIGVAIAGTETVEFGPGGIHKGGKLIGEIFDWTGSNAPALCVLPYGQTLSRTAYADLWAFAQIEIAAGNTLYNNGNGSTTFGVPDMRGRGRAAKDNMGGSAASRLTSATMTPDGNTLGAAGGSQTHTLSAAQIPTITSTNPSQNITSSPPSGAFALVSGITSLIATAGGTPIFQGPLSTSNGFVTPNSISVTSSNTGGAAHPIMQPTIITNCALFAGA